MGTHPIFESDFDCLTDFQRNYKEQYAHKIDQSELTNKNRSLKG